MGRTKPSRRILVQTETARTSRVKPLLRPEERVVLDDLLTQCKLYASEAGCLASPVKGVPLLLSTIFAQHNRPAELEKCLNETQRRDSTLEPTLFGRFAKDPEGLTVHA